MVTLKELNAMFSRTIVFHWGEISKEKSQDWVFVTYIALLFVLHECILLHVYHSPMALWAWGRWGRDLSKHSFRIFSIASRVIWIASNIAPIWLYSSLLTKSNIRIFLSLHTCMYMFWRAINLSTKDYSWHTRINKLCFVRRYLKHRIK